METNISENLPNFPQSKSARKKQRARERDAELKENDREEWERRREEKNEKHDSSPPTRMKDIAFDKPDYSERGFM